MGAGAAARPLLTLLICLGLGLLVFGGAQQTHAAARTVSSDAPTVVSAPAAMDLRGPSGDPSCGPEFLAESAPESEDGDAEPSSVTISAPASIAAGLRDRGRATSACASKRPVSSGLGRGPPTRR